MNPKISKSNKSQPPYQNSSLDDIKEEIWQPVPYCDKVFISNQGRVKSFLRSPNGKIIAQRLYTKGELLLAFKFSINGKEREFRTAAVVYQVFVGELDFNKYNIIYKDGNGLNLHPSNLEAVKRRKQVKKEERLKKELNIAATASMYQYPYQNLSLVDMDGEVWKPMPGLEDYYEVSNKGRIKSLGRIGIKKDGTKLNFSPLIMKQNLKYNYNNYTEETNGYLSICTRANEEKKEFMVSRLIYAAFVGDFDYSDPHLIVRHKDNDGLNNFPDNLFLFYKADLNKYLLDNNLKPRLSGSSDPGKWTKEKWRSFHDFKQKPISQFDLQGNYIRSFESRTIAAKHLGTTATTLSSVIIGRIRTFGGYLWRDGIHKKNLKPEDIPAIKEHLKSPFKPKITAKFDLEGNLLQVYPSIKEAAIQNGLKIHDITKKMKNPAMKTKKNNPYQWKYFQSEMDIIQKIH